MSESPKRAGFYVCDENTVLWYGKQPKDKASRWFKPAKPDLCAPFTVEPCEAPASWSVAKKAEHLVHIRKLCDIKPTREQAIQNAFKDSASSFISRPLLEVPRSNARQFKPGDLVSVGNLSNCVIVAESTEFPGQYAVEHDPIKRRNPGNDSETRVIGAWAWFDILPREVEAKEIKCSNFAELGRKLRQTSINANWLVRLVLSRQLDTSMAYQRGYVWTLADKKKLIRSVIECRPIGAIVILAGKGLEIDQLVDGKQRLNALVEYVSGQFDVDGVHYHELARRQRFLLDDYQVSVYQIHESASQAEVLDIFLCLNDSGVPQSEEHLEQVRALLKQEQENQAKAC